MEKWESKMRDAYDSFNMDEEESKILWERIRKTMEGQEYAVETFVVLPIQKKHPHAIKRRLIAAASAAAVLGIFGIAAYATGFLGFRAASGGHTLESEEKTVTVWPTNEYGGDVEPKEGETVPLPHEEVVNVVTEREYISLAGYRGSPEYEAQMEWVDFYWDYISEHPVLCAVCPNGEAEWYQEWCDLYDCTDEAMEDKLDDILERYGLEHHNTMTIVCNSEELCALLGAETLLYKEDEGIFSGYYYDDGSFHIETIVCLNSGEDILFSLDRCQKGVLNTAMINVGDASDFEESEYISGQGITANIAIRPCIYNDAAGNELGPTTIILIDNPKAMLSIHAHIYKESGEQSALTEAQAKELIEMIRWDALIG